MQNSPSPDLKSVVEQARELLAAEYEAEGFPRIARYVRSGSSILSAPVVCRAIEKALLTQKDRLDKLTAALEEIISPLSVMQKRAEADGNRLSGMAYQIANSVSYLQEIARKALTGSHT